MAGLPSRRSGRVIVLDPADRVLLLRYDDDPLDGQYWATPGGGLNPGESYAAAASRELAEETGWDDVVLLGEIYRHVRMVENRGRIVRQHECLFLARTDRACRELGDVAAMHESDGIAAWRWWTLAELDTTAEVIWPAGLAGLIRGALRAWGRALRRTPSVVVSALPGLILATGEHRRARLYAHAGDALAVKAPGCPQCVHRHLQRRSAISRPSQCGARECCGATVSRCRLSPRRRRTAGAGDARAGPWRPA
jgi:ADP-ribose pyrophosphatase YjhB (NUDIX family)